MKFMARRATNSVHAVSGSVTSLMEGDAMGFLLGLGFVKKRKAGCLPLFYCYLAVN